MPAAWDPGATSMVAWIERAMGPGSRVTRIEALPDSATAKHRFDVTLVDGSTRRLLLRRFHDAQRLARDPWYVPAHEALALRLLADAAIPAPRLHAEDLEAAICDVPGLLVTWLPGEPGWRAGDLEIYLARAADVLVAIHAVAVPPDVPLPRYAPYRQREPIVAPPFSSRPRLWDRVAELLGGPRPRQRETFIHRDYHPGNVLWDGTHVTGVIDWSTAAWGPPGIDLARMRLNLALHHGLGPANRFAQLYASSGGDPSARDPYWDLLDAADLVLDLHSPPGPAGGDFARFERYVESVLGETR